MVEKLTLGSQFDKPKPIRCIVPTIRKEERQIDHLNAERMEIDDEPELKDFKRVLINPVMLEETGEKWFFSEGCLSIPNIREDVSREERIKIQYYDRDWNFREEEFDGYAARIIQHEYDHIDGILFTDHLNPLKKKLLKRKLKDISKGSIDVAYKMKFPLLKGR